MLKWLTERTYNRFDPLWLCLSALSWRDHNYFATAVAVIGGLFVSSALEVWNDTRRPTPEAKET
jgi:hypothetical protein